MPRRSAEETRQLLLAEGLRQLQARGVRFGLEHITLESACKVTGVARSSSHSAWSIDEEISPQGMFQREVVLAWLRNRQVTAFAERAQHAVLELYEQRGGAVTPTEIMRCGMQAALAATLESGEGGSAARFLPADLAIKYSVVSQRAEDADPIAQESVRVAELENRVLRVERTYKPLAELLNYVPKSEFGDAAYDHLAIAMASLVEGIVLRHLMLPGTNIAFAEIMEVEEGAPPATLLGVCVEAVVHAFFEPA